MCTMHVCVCMYIFIYRHIGKHAVFYFKVLFISTLKCKSARTIGPRGGAEQHERRADQDLVGLRGAREELGSQYAQSAY